MCTAISYKSGDHYFGRNLDLEHRFTEQVTITPRNYPFAFRNGRSIKHHYAMIGMATIVQNYPLYYDAVNECGLCMAGLNFPEFAVYQDSVSQQDAIAPFELIPWILGHCQNVQCAKRLLERTGLWNIPFSQEYALTPLHWILSDGKECIVVEPADNGLHILDNPVGVLTNSPPFEYHLLNLRNYTNLSQEKNIGAVGLPGDYSSPSRFIKAAFVKNHALQYQKTDSCICSFFHILESVSPPNGCVHTDSGMMRTVYSSCCNASRGIYHYKTWENSQITAIDMNAEDLDCDQLISYPIRTTLTIHWENR